MEKKPKIGVILSGCGVYDGSEIHEATLCLLELMKAGAEYQCMAPDIDQHHVVNHATGDEIDQKRNVFIESARIARGEIVKLHDVKVDEYDGFLMPGGFGVAKNLSKWAFEGPEGEIDAEVKRVIIAALDAKKPLAAVCMAPAVLAKAIQGSDYNLKLTIGTTEAASPYDIQGIADGMTAAGAQVEMVGVEGVVTDVEHRVVSSPCYMMEATILDIEFGVKKTVAEFMKFVGAAQPV